MTFLFNCANMRSTMRYNINDIIIINTVIIDIVTRQFICSRVKRQELHCYTKLYRLNVRELNFLFTRHAASGITVRVCVTTWSSSWRVSQRWCAVIASAVSRANCRRQFCSRSIALSQASSLAITASLKVRMSLSSNSSSDLIARIEGGITG